MTQCGRCREVKPKEDFYANRVGGGRDGLQSYCKPCQKIIEQRRDRSRFRGGRHKCNGCDVIFDCLPVCPHWEHADPVFCADCQQRKRKAS